MSKPNKFAALTQQVAQPPAEEDVVEAPVSRLPVPTRTSEEKVRMLGGRVPDSIFREFQRQKMQAEEQLGVRKITVEEGLEAMIRLLRSPEGQAAWVEMVLEVRQERRE